MNLKIIIIYQNDILFNILNEIKEKFNLDIIRIDEKKFKELKKDTSSDYLIISGVKKDGMSNQLIIDKKPIKIEKLIEIINLKFLKTNFNYQSSIVVGSYKLNINSREINRNNITLDLTEREINLILFLKNSKSAVKIDELQKRVWEYGSELETHTVETHIYRLRKKLKKKFDDDNFILSSKKGYLIN